MVRLLETDSNPKVEDAAERHIRLCNQNSNAEKYKNLIVPRLDDFKEKLTKLSNAQKEVNAVQDVVWLKDEVLDNVLRDLSGHSKIYDRNNVGSNTATFLFPSGNVSDIITLPDKEEPDVAHGVAQKVLTLGTSHELYPYADKIEKAVADCRTALSQQVLAIQNLGDAKTAVTISKIALVRQYNANFFLAASDVDKAFAEKLFPQLYSKKKNGNGDATDTTDKK